MSAEKSAFDISIQNTTKALFRSASTAASCASSSRTSSGCIIKPAQSNKTHLQCANEYAALRTSLVVFRLCETILLSLPNSLLSKLLFPAFGAPAIPTAGKSITLSYLMLPASSSSSCPFTPRSLSITSAPDSGSISSPLKSSPASIKLRQSTIAERTFAVVSDSRPLRSFSAASN